VFAQGIVFEAVVNGIAFPDTFFTEFIVGV
jgi:hypothetical protein